MPGSPQLHIISTALCWSDIDEIRIFHNAQDLDSIFESRTIEDNVMPLYQYPFHLIKRNLIVSPIIKPGRPGRFMISHLLGYLQFSTIP